jgi:ParB/RepB/Spo0J family partition protein
MHKREMGTLSLEQIIVTQGRELNMDVVASMASSIKLLGLQNPISVLADEDGKFRIISGRHRLAAVHSLGWDQIEVLISHDLSEIDVRLAEIVENLHRAELTKLERSEQFAKYANLVKEKRELSPAQLGQHPSNVKGASGREGGDSAVARDLGLTRQGLQRAAKIAAIDPEAKAAAKKAGLDDNQGALLEAAAAPKEQQKDVITELALKKARKPKGKQRAGKDVNATVEAILRDFGASDVQLIINALSEGLAKRAVEVTPAAPAQRNEIDPDTTVACPTAPCDPDTDAEIDWEEIKRDIERVELESRQAVENDEQFEKMWKDSGIDEALAELDA